MLFWTHADILLLNHQHFHIWLKDKDLKITPTVVVKYFPAGVYLLLSQVQLCATLWTTVLQAPPSMGSSRPEYWSGSPFPFSGNLHDPGIKPQSPALAGEFFITEPPWKPLYFRYHCLIFDLPLLGVLHTSMRLCVGLLCLFVLSETVKWSGFALLKSFRVPAIDKMYKEKGFP